MFRDNPVLKSGLKSRLFLFFFRSPTSLLLYVYCLIIFNVL